MNSQQRPHQADPSAWLRTGTSAAILESAQVDFVIWLARINSLGDCALLTAIDRRGKLCPQSEHDSQVRVSRDRAWVKNVTLPRSHFKIGGEHEGSCVHHENTVDHSDCSRTGWHFHLLGCDTLVDLVVKCHAIADG